MTTAQNIVPGSHFVPESRTCGKKVFAKSKELQTLSNMVLSRCGLTPNCLLNFRLKKYIKSKL